MARFNLITSTGTTVTTDTTTAAGGALLTIFDEAGVGALATAISVAGYEVQVDGAGALPAGTGTADLFLANATNDLIIWDSAAVTGVTFNNPSDRHRLNTANGTVAYERFDLGAGNDIIDLTHSAAGAGTPGAYALSATIFGNAGNDIIASGAGDDRLLGDGNALGSVAPTPGRDTLFDGTGNDTLFGEGGNDSLQGLSGTDTFFGGGGNDTINSGAGDDDWTYGGAGDDVLIGADTA